MSPVDRQADGDRSLITVVPAPADLSGYTATASDACVELTGSGSVAGVL